MPELVMDALTLVVALRLAGRRIRPLRVALGAALGTLAALLCRALQLTRMQTAVLWLPVAALMMLVAGGNRRAPLRGALLVMSAAGLLGGLVQALGGALGSLPAAYALAILCALGSAAYGVHRAGHGVSRVLIRYRDRQAAFPALIDSGNGLCDYLSRRPVIVLPEGEARERLGLSGAALRPIVAKTAGGTQLMWCFLPQETVLVSSGSRQRVCAAVALSPGLTGDAPALVPLALV